MQEQNHVIGETAGKIYRALEKSGAIETASLQKEASVPDSTLFNQALGWLAREGYVLMKGENLSACTLTLNSLRTQ